MALDNAKNFSKVVVSTGYDDSATTVVLNASEGAKLPTAPFNAVWYNSTDYPDPTDDPNKEIIRITVVSTDTLTITRAQESTSAATHNTGGKTYKIIAGITAKVINTDIPGMSITGTAANLSGTPSLPNGTTATTQTSGDNSTKLATTSYVDNSDWKTSEAATYVSQDGSTGVFNIASNVTGKYSPGMRYKYQQSQALTAYWTFDTNSNSQVGSFNGTDTAVTYTAGKFSNAATFNGTTSKIVIADNASLKPTGEFTLGMWFKTSTTGAYQELFQSESANTSQAGIKLEIQNTNILQFFIGKNTGITVGTDYLQFNGTVNVCDNAWHYVVVSYRNNYIQMYLDGKLESSGYSFAPAYAATNYVRVGCRNSSGSDSLFFNGQIDDLFLINGYALDEKTIKKQYDAQAAQGTGNITIDKYALITAVAPYAAGVTPITIWGGTDYSLQNATISSPYYATVKSPFGFDTDQNKWKAELSNNVILSQASPTANTWYNIGSLSLPIPIGVWSIEYFATVNYNVTGANSAFDVKSTLSTANNSASDSDFTSGITLFTTASGQYTGSMMSKRKSMKILSKTTYYLNHVNTSTVAGAINLSGSTSTTIIRATSTLL